MLKNWKAWYAENSRSQCGLPSAAPCISMPSSPNCTVSRASARQQQQQQFSVDERAIHSCGLQLFGGKL